jgi:regulator of extracellular matrix RemA (YlzA/DUF370 family)
MRIRKDTRQNYARRVVLTNNDQVLLVAVHPSSYANTLPRYRPCFFRVSYRHEESDVTES